MQAFVYARQSSGDGEESLSIDVQVESCLNYAEKNGFEIGGVFKDYNISGRCYPCGAENIAEKDIAFQTWFEESSKTELKKYRAGLGELFAKLSKDYVIIVDDSTRLMRPLQASFLESYINQILINKNIIIHTCKNGVVDASKFNDNLISTLQNLIESQSILIKSKKAKDGKTKLRDDGYLDGGKAKMLGYKQLAYQKFEIIEAEAEIIRKAFKLCADGVAFASISKALKEDFVRIGRKPYRNNMIKRLFERVEYIGMMKNSKGDEIESKVFKAIVSKKLFFQVQEVLELRKGTYNREKKDVYPLSGLVFCGKCGRRLSIGVARNHRKPATQYYTCYPSFETSKHIRLRYSDFQKLKGFDEVLDHVEEEDDFYIADYKKGVTLFTDQKFSVGLYNALYPVIFFQLSNELIDKRKSEDLQEESYILKSEIKKIDDFEKKLSTLFLQEVIDDVQFENAMKEHRESRKLKLEKLKKFEVRKLSKDDDIESVIFKALKFELTKNEVRILFQKVLEKVVCFDDHIEVHLKDNVSFNLQYEEIVSRGKRQRSFPQWVAKAVKDSDGIKWKITYKSNEVKTIIETENFKFLTK